MDRGGQRPDDPGAGRVRRPPPPFRRVAVARVERRTPRLVRVTLAGPELEGLSVDQPAASVRLLLPGGTGELVVPEWTGNEFRLADGVRPTIRTLTPRRLDPAGPGLDLEIVVHGEGAASRWAEGAEPGAEAAVSGPGRGYAVDTDAGEFLLAGDETALPAISQLLEVIPADRPVRAVLEIADPAARLDLPARPGLAVDWLDLPAGAPPGDALAGWMQDAPIGGGTRVWVAGEAAGVQRVRRHLFSERGLARGHATVRGYWKHGRTADDAGGTD